MNNLLKLCLLAFAIQSVCALWPKPQQMESTDKMYTVDKANFAFLPAIKTNYILNEAMIRYNSLLFIENSPIISSPKYPLLTGLQITVANPEAPLGPETDESYTLIINTPNSVLTSKSVYGALRGLETFSQLVQLNRTIGNYVVQEAKIIDSPRFAFRSVLIDTSRHYIDVNTIFQFLDAMAYNKFNVLHWHIVDDQSFPYVSQVYPNLAEKGAYSPYDTHIYSPGDVQSVIEYAMLRGIRVIPEFDTPGHSTSWSKGYPAIGTQCYSNGVPVNDGSVPINPIPTATYTFLSNFFKEVSKVFPDNYIHLGGDELSYDCWASNPQIQQFMNSKGWGSQFNLLEQYYEAQLIQIIQALNKRYIVWEDVYDNNVKLDPRTIIAVWRGSWQDTIAKTTASGFQSILYSPWYLNYISYGDDWVNYYAVEPTAFVGTPAQKSLVIGGSATFWAEFIDATNLVTRAWPRSSAVGERLWSAQGVNSTSEALPRLHNFRCLLIKRGIPAEPIDESTPCDREFETHYQPPWGVSK